MGRIKQNKPRKQSSAPLNFLIPVGTEGEGWTALGALFAEYCRERMLAGEFPWGVPVDVHRVPFLVANDHEYVGFIAVDRTRQAVELVYVKPGHRRQGYARKMLHAAGRSMRQTRVAAKGPFSQAGLAMVEGLGMRKEPQPPADKMRQEVESRAYAERLEQARLNPCREHLEISCTECLTARAVSYAVGALSAGRTAYEKILKEALEDL